MVLDTVKQNLKFAKRKLSVELYYSGTAVLRKVMSGERVHLSNHSSTITSSQLGTWNAVYHYGDITHTPHCSLGLYYSVVALYHNHTL